MSIFLRSEIKDYRQDFLTIVIGSRRGGQPLPPLTNLLQTKKEMPLYLEHLPTLTASLQ
ncbi:hypothetical protein POREN0001_0240 [Porphyromonas endodontalis ATCC 35406]|uniref:Uncharacterized protein n=1 Tax=Porphyromonas endodontalis (strain ATCC 35406 / DSM 24491 / JCM 8526 / CCUG 16442 / BCRC 14492 / NCTC 13058 / HG 370) TaxID=553175 RepID=C3JAK3_POREA|nr:hypothetical protein POREN0001_0240 [Porphyromonas endodontalis ATCC 35406]